MGRNRSRIYVVTEDADVLAPGWLAVRINYDTVKFVYRLEDGRTTLKGVRVGAQMAAIGDIIRFDGRRLSVERR